MTNPEVGVRQVGTAVVARGSDGHLRAYCLRCEWECHSVSRTDVAAWIAAHSREHLRPDYAFQTAEYAEGAGPPYQAASGSEVG